MSKHQFLILIVIDVNSIWNINGSLCGVCNTNVAKLLNLGTRCNLLEHFKMRSRTPRRNVYISKYQ